MKPLSSKHFGAEDGKIAIRFHNGTSVVTGSIVKQSGTVRYHVTENGSTTHVVTLAQTAAKAAALTAGLATIEGTLDGEAVFVSNLRSKQAKVIGGGLVAWSLDDVEGAVKIKAIAPVVATPPTPPAPGGA